MKWLTFIIIGYYVVVAQKKRALTALMEAKDGSNARGTVSAHFYGGGDFLFTLNMEGLDPDCGNPSNCLIFISDSKSCEDDGNSFYEGDSDPFQDLGKGYFTYGGGYSSSSFKINNGYFVAKNKNHAVIVRNSTSHTVSCGILKGATKKRLQANIGLYPGYGGTQSVSGSVRLNFVQDKIFHFCYDLSGLEDSVEGGIHIHSGTTCENHNEVMGHYWNPNFVEDLWFPAEGAIYSSDSNGNANACFALSNGYSKSENVDHAVVVHDSSGGRVGCGLLTMM